MQRITQLLCTIMLLVTTSYSYANESFSLYFVRHAEKQANAGKDPELTDQGHQRAAYLAQMLKNADIKAVYSTDYKRTQQTATPIALWLKQPISSYNPKELAPFIKEMLVKQQNAVIVGHSNTTPAAVALAGGKADSIDESHYGDLFQLIFQINNGEAKLIEQVNLSVPPQMLQQTAPLTFDSKRIKEESYTYQMSYGAQKAGTAQYSYAKSNDTIKVTEHTVIDKMNIDATILAHMDSKNLSSKSMTMSGSMGKPSVISVKFDGNHVSGASEMPRSSFKPQGKLAIERTLPANTYERTSILMAMHGLALGDKAEHINWYNAYDDELKSIAIKREGTETVTVPAGTFETDKISVTGGAPSQIYYVDRKSPKVVKIEVVGQPWIYELIQAVE